MGHAGVAVDGVGAEQEDLWDDRGVAQPGDRGRMSTSTASCSSAAGPARCATFRCWAIGVNSDGYREIVPIIDAPPTTVGRACPVSERCGNRPTTTQDRQ